MDKCIFCRKELGMMQKKKLFCGTGTQILCKECYLKYEPLSSIERAEAAYETGRAENMTELEKYLDNIRNVKMKKQESIKSNTEKLVTDKECLRCHGRILDYGPVTFKLGEETYFFSDYNRLLSGSLVMHLLRCEDCGKVEFYIPDASELDEILEENEEI